MSHKHRKIEIATPEDVAKYAQNPQQRDSAEPSSGSPPAGESPAPGPAGQDAAATPTSEVETLRAEIEQWKDKFLRAKAELANFQRRSSQERAEAIKFANAEFARGLLTVVDDLERALAHVGGVSADGDAVVQALRLIYDNLVKVLKEHHVEPIEAAGQPFDPACHHALMQRSSREHREPTVLEVLQKGYRLHDRVLRPAQVVVSKPAEESASEEAGSPAARPGEEGAAGADG